VELDHPFGHERCTGASRRVEKRRVESRAAGDRERAGVERNDRVAESRRTNRRSIDRRGWNRVGDDGERASRDAAAARFFARMRRIEDRDARPLARERIRRPRTGRPGADDCDIEFQRAAPSNQAQPP
jgi:hypothetical protein